MRVPTEFERDVKLRECGGSESGHECWAPAQTATESPPSRQSHSDCTDRKPRELILALGSAGLGFVQSAHACFEGIDRLRLAAERPVGPIAAQRDQGLNLLNALDP